jgi:WD40 repeat protein
MISLVTLAVLTWVGCSSESTPFSVSLPSTATATLTPTEQVVSPAQPAASGSTPAQATIVASPSPVSSPPPTSPLTLPVLAGTPVPMPNEPITPDNVDRIQQLAMWGKGRIEQLAYSPDGKILAVGTTAGVWLYDAETLAELRFINTGNFVGSLAFTSDSQKLVTDVGASTLATWDVTTGELLNSVRVRDGYQGNVVYAPGRSVLSAGAMLLAATLDDLTVGLWDVATGKPLQLLKGDNAFYPPKNLVFSPDQTLLAASSDDKTINLWDVRTGNLLHTLTEADLESPSLAFSPGRGATTLLAASGSEGKVWLWDAHSGAPIRTLEASSPSAQVFSPAFSSDGALLAVKIYESSSNPDVSSMGVIQIWQTTDGTLLRTLKEDIVGLDLMFSPDDRLLLSSSSDGTVQRWNAQTGAPIDMLTNFDRNTTVYTPPLPAFLLDGSSVYISNPSKDRIELWNLSTGRLQRTLTGLTSYVNNLVVSADGSTLASSELWDYSVRLWEAKTGQSLGNYKVYMDVGYGKELAVSPDGKLIATGDSRDGAGVYSVQTGEQLYALEGVEKGINNLAYSPNGAILAAISGERTLTLINAQTGTFRHKLQTSSFAVGLAFSPDSDLVTVGTNEGVIELWDVAKGELVGTLTGETRDILSVAFSPDGQILAAGIRDPRLLIGSLTPTIQLWDMKTRSLLTPPVGYAANVTYITFSPDGKLLTTASLDGTMRLWGMPPR